MATKNIIKKQINSTTNSSLQLKVLRIRLANRILICLASSKRKNPSLTTRASWKRLRSWALRMSYIRLSKVSSKTKPGQRPPGLLLMSCPVLHCNCSRLPNAAGNWREDSAYPPNLRNVLPQTNLRTIFTGEQPTLYSLPITKSSLVSLL